MLSRLVCGSLGVTGVLFFANYVKLIAIDRVSVISDEVFALYLVATSVIGVIASTIFLGAAYVYICFKLLAYAWKEKQ